ncbi:competence type IV pilus minor pilin ComGD [Cytobacillus sp. S13-E01]|uniref:competence type IV pilus minor pilin ComGD n=1 Tax=Cytobacillus sp. S13-E01 TaxID=3031326 RepID=UPI0023D80C3A|nr:competence type IV pilus minor pilin ComGD [Cytobacillus sp. S13-E01]MDF0727789.1 competence type IV pilus minor pilin ComGD [Cytobacillus sp. S13-E01]
MHQTVAVPNQKGFTLIEVLLVLLIISTLTSLTLIQFKPIFDSKKIEYFFETFENDLLFAQTYAMSHNETVYVYFTVNEHQYRVLAGSTRRQILSREFSKDIKLEYSNLIPGVVYLANGNLSKSGSLVFKYKKDVYQVTFLLGKGRFYVKKV